MKVHSIMSLSFFFIFVPLFCFYILPFVSADIAIGQVNISNATEESNSILINHTNINIGGNARYSCNYDTNYDWACSAWSPCTNGKQAKECKKYNNCGNDYGRPVTEITCENKASTTFLSNATPDNKSDNPKEALFDIIAEIVTEPKTAGENLTIKISLINFGALNTIDTNLEYTILDSNGEIVRQYTQIIPVTTQTEFLDHINTIGLIEGKYTLKIELTYAGQVESASTEKIFYIGKVGLLQGLFKNIGVKAFLLSAITMALLIGIYRKSRINKLKEDTDNNTNANNNP